MDTIEEIKKIFVEESMAILDVSENLGKEYIDAIDLLFNCKGKIIVTGLGKSGIVGKKIAATLASTGSPSFFIHATEALHGDLGMINEEDVVIAISNSGETKEVIDLMPSLKRKGIKIISITKNNNSSLAKSSDVVLNTKIEKEAGELGLAPTTSTTLTIVIGDALAMCLLKKRNFKPENYALLHPGGSLGKRLLLKIEDIMHNENENPIVNENAKMHDAIFEITSKRLGAVSIIDANKKLLGILTDGDLRRAMEEYGKNIFEKNIKEIMTKNPIYIRKDKLGAEALHLMEDRSSQIMVLPVVDQENKVVGMVRIHDLIKAGIS